MIVSENENENNETLPVSACWHIGFKKNIFQQSKLQTYLDSTQ